MSSIDQYKHELLGFIKCDSTYDFVFKSKTRLVAVYRLLQNVPASEATFDGKSGDILVGGGNGEASAFRISVPQAFKFFTDDDWDDYLEATKIFKAFWSATDSFKFGEGYKKSGWNPYTPIEFWLAENVCKALVIHFQEFKNYKFTQPDSEIEFSIKNI